MKRIMITWTCILVLMVACLTLVGLKIKKENINKLMENEIKKQTEKYLGYYINLLPTKNDVRKISVDDLIENGYDPKLENGCNGYIIVKNESMGFSYTPYLKCPEYETKGYSEN